MEFWSKRKSVKSRARPGSAGHRLEFAESSCTKSSTSKLPSRDLCFLPHFGYIAERAPWGMKAPEIPREVTQWHCTWPARAIERTLRAFLCYSTRGNMSLLRCWQSSPFSSQLLVMLRQVGPSIWPQVCRLELWVFLIPGRSSRVAAPRRIASWFLMEACPRD